MSRLVPLPAAASPSALESTSKMALMKGIVMTSADNGHGVLGLVNLDDGGERGRRKVWASGHLPPENRHYGTLEDRNAGEKGPDGLL